MFFLLSKLLDFLLKPVLWVLILFGIALLSRNSRVKSKCLGIAIACLLFFTNPFFSNEAWLMWEANPVPIAALPYHDAAIVLTGVTDDSQPLQDRVYTNKGADRFLHAITLYRRGKIGHIIISGGDGSVMGQKRSEASAIREILRDAQVPDSAILLEDKSRNTYENAQFTAALLQGQPQIKSLLLITSAFHMRRAKGCFDKAGITTTPFPADFYGRPRQWTPDRWLIPKEESLGHWRILIHEWTGYILYKMKGYQ